jgi:hypothetical protein
MAKLSLMRYGERKVIYMADIRIYSEECFENLKGCGHFGVLCES